MNQRPQLFAGLRKFNEFTGYFEAVLADETLDLTGEIFDYTSSKPYFKEWSAYFEKATGGQSQGNLRAMHGKVSAGIFKKVELDDVNKQVIVCGEIVDENERKKAAKGCYTGLSIGGDYVGDRWEDKVLKGMRYTAKPKEGSLVDMPCNPNAMFTVIKADSTEELRKFAPREDDTALTTEEAEALKKFAEDPAGMPSPLLQGALAKVARRKDTNAKEGEDKYGNVTFADATNKKYPIDTAKHIRAAWNYINKAKNSAKYDAKDAAAIKSKIVAAWKEKIDPAGPPSAAKAEMPADMEKAAFLDCAASSLVEKAAGDEKVAKQLQALAAFYGQPLEKGLWTVARLAEILASLDCVICDTKYEADYEGDDSTVPAQLREAAANVGHVLLVLAEEEVDEAFGEGPDEDEEPMERSAQAVMTKFATLRKDAGPELEKRATAAEAKVAELEKATTAAGEKVKALEKDLSDGHTLMQKAADTIEEQKRVITKMMGEPSAKRPAMFVLDKAADKLEAPGEDKEEKPILKADGTPDLVRTALKKALSKPIVQS